jgi:hypothetical protein
MIPKPIVAVTEAARRVVAVRKELQAAKKSGEVNEAGIARRQKELQRALNDLSKHVALLEQQIEAAKVRHRGSALPWAKLFQFASDVVSLSKKVKDGVGAKETIGAASRFVHKHGAGARDDDEDIVDGELVD